MQKGTQEFPRGRQNGLKSRDRAPERDGGYCGTNPLILPSLFYMRPCPSPPPLLLSRDFIPLPTEKSQRLPPAWAFASPRLSTLLFSVPAHAGLGGKVSLSFKQMTLNSHRESFPNGGLPCPSKDGQHWVMMAGSSVVPYSSIIHENTSCKEKRAQVQGE